ncbi:MAG: SemiSWEET family transporter [Malacoplasma sp.]
MDTINLIITVFGWISTILTIGVYIPQLIKTIKSKDTSGVSLIMYIILQITAWTWVIYGALIVYQAMISNGDILDGLPILITNAVVAFIGLGIIYIKAKNIMGAKAANISEKDYIARITKSKIN